MSVRAHQGLVIRGWHVLAAMLAFFGAIIAVNVAFAVIAVRSFPGEDVRRSYLQGLNYNQTLAERREQAALGWQAAAALRADGDVAVVEIDLRARDGAPIDRATIEGQLTWRSATRFDRALTFAALGEGRYAARIGDLRPGQWRLRARAAGDAGQALDFEADLTWPSSR